MTLALVDADIVAFRCACTAENDPEEAAIGRANELVLRILADVEASSHELYLGSRTNWRKEIYPEYKANRKDKPKPKWLDACNQFLRDQWGAKSEEGLEADDLLAIRQYECLEQGLSSVICSIDKDLLTVPGAHYNFVKLERSFVSPLQALRRFYGQVIAGDGADNIPSYDFKLRNQVPKFIQAHIDQLNEMTEEAEMYEYCLQLYKEVFGNPLGFGPVQEVLNKNAKVLYLLKKRNEFWNPPNMSTS